MTTVKTYGDWESTEDGFKKETGTTTLFITHTQHPDTLYCFIEYGTSTIEYELQPVKYIDKLLKEVMKRETHGEDIVDVVEDIGFHKL